MSLSLAKLTALSTQTLSLLLERQRLHTLSANSAVRSPTGSSLHLQQITRNLGQLRAGVLELETKEGRSEALDLLRSQYERMRGMLGPDGEVIDSLDEPANEMSTPRDGGTPPLSLPPLPPSSSSPLRHTSPPPAVPPKDGEHVYARYTDDPEAGYGEPAGILLQTQQRMMDEQDGHLDRLSHSIGRQRDISFQINDELDVHTGLLEELDTEVDRTEGRLSGARRRLEKVAKGTKENGSTVIIIVLILVLLILIIVFKT